MMKIVISFVMVSAVLLFAAAIMLMSCTTTQTFLGENATTEKLQESLCTDAKFGVLLATRWLAEPTTTTEQALYWSRYAGAAQTAFDLYCKE